MTKKRARCECGAAWADITGFWQPCGEPATVTIETMPACWRASHEAAGNSGTYPLNGASRYRVSASCAGSLVESDPEWTSVVGKAVRS